MRKNEEKENTTPTYHLLVLLRFTLLCSILFSSYQLISNYCIFCMPIRFLCKHFVLHHSLSEVLPTITVWRKKLLEEE